MFVFFSVGLREFILLFQDNKNIHAYMVARKNGGDFFVNLMINSPINHKTPCKKFKRSTHPVLISET